MDILLEDITPIAASGLYKANSHLDPGLYAQANQNRLAFWETQARSLQWEKPWETVLDWQRPYAQWFKEGQLNAAVNCCDRHLARQADKTAIIWQGEDDSIRRISYQELSQKVQTLAAYLESMGTQKGDRVTLYMPMLPELVVAVLACARIGAIHSVVFGGFSSQSLQDRLLDSDSSVLITAACANRKGSQIPLGEWALSALDHPKINIKNILWLDNDQKGLPKLSSQKCHSLSAVLSRYQSHQAKAFDAETPLFMLYTSGTTGKPKGIVHTTGGYLTHAHYSTKTVFDLNNQDIYWCTADVGWITGHTYLIYGPLSNGATVFMYEGTPDYPDKNRFWELIEQHQITVLYTAPTAIRAFMKWGDQHIVKHKLDSLRLLGTVGEPINPDVWLWYYDKIGGSKCPIVDTWWQTETGGIMISNLPALNDMKPGRAGFPLPGIEAQILDERGIPVSSGGGYLSLTQPWPSMLRGIWGDAQRYEEVYWSKFETYFAGDGAAKDTEGYFMVVGRVDDVVNISGHRIGTMEVESALVSHSAVAEAAVVGIPDELTGQALVAFVMLKESVGALEAVELKNHVATVISPIAKPKQIVFVSDLPKTRSGKIMRRILKNLLVGKEAGDATTLANPAAVEAIQKSLNILG